jgi:hypothetical protein
MDPSVQLFIDAVSATAVTSCLRREHLTPSPKPGVHRPVRNYILDS